MVVLDTIITNYKNGLHRRDLRILCRDAGVPSAIIERVVKSLIIKRRIIMGRRSNEGILRAEGRGLENV